MLQFLRKDPCYRSRVRRIATRLLLLSSCIFPVPPKCISTYLTNKVRIESPRLTNMNNIRCSLPTAWCFSEPLEPLPKIELDLDFFLKKKHPQPLLYLGYQDISAAVFAKTFCCREDADFSNNIPVIEFVLVKRLRLR